MFLACDTGCTDCLWDEDNGDPFVCKEGKCASGYVQSANMECHRKWREIIV